MSTFAVESCLIEKIWKHPNADRLELAKVTGLTYQFVVGKGDFSPGDIVIYFPVDSLLPNELIATINKHQKIDVSSYLYGKNRNRVKTIKLRQEISQGLCLRPHAVGLPTDFKPGIDVTNLLGVTKYEPAISNHLPGFSGRLEPRHSKVSYYDIEGTERYKEQLESLMTVPCFVSEKLEGMNVAVLREPNGDIAICSRNCTVKRIPGSFWGKLWASIKALFARKQPESLHYLAVKNSEIIEGMEYLAETQFPNSDLIVRGEVVGPNVQGNIYNMDKLSVYVFDIQVNGKYLNAMDMMQCCDSCDFTYVPGWFGLTLSAWLNGKTVDEASNGKSVLADTLREGIVIRPLEERFDPKLGRLMLKKRSPEYLAASDM